MQPRDSGSVIKLAPYVLGNGGALFLGLLSCFGVLALQGGFELRGLDVFFYYCVSHLVVTGHGADVYNLHALAQVESALAPSFVLPGGVVPNAYPPSFVLLLAPLGALPYHAAYIVWLAANCALLALALYALERYAMLSRRASLLFRALTVISLPVMLALLHGQSSILILCCLAFAVLALEQGRDVLGGAALAGMLAKPQYLPALLVALAVLSRWKTIAAFFVVAVGQLGVAALFLGAGSTGAWLHVLRSATGWSHRPGFSSPAMNRGIAGAVQLVLAGPVAELATLGISLAILAVMVAAVRRAGQVDVAIALATVVAVLISPHVLIHDLALLAVPVAVALRHRESRRRSLSLLLTGGYVCVISGFAVSLFLPVQLSVPAVLALGVWLLGIPGERARIGFKGVAQAEPVRVPA